MPSGAGDPEVSRILTVRRRVQPEDTRELDAAARRFRSAERTLHEEMFRAHRAGSSLRVIATLTGHSHETVRVVVQRIAEWAEREQKILNMPADGFAFDSNARVQRDIEKRRARLDYLLGVKDSDE